MSVTECVSWRPSFRSLSAHPKRARRDVGCSQAVPVRGQVDGMDGMRVSGEWASTSVSSDQLGGVASRDLLVAVGFNSRNADAGHTFTSRHDVCLLAEDQRPRAIHV